MPAADLLRLPPITIKLLAGACLLAAVLPNATKRNRLALVAGVLLLVIARDASERALVPLDARLLLALVGITGLLAAGAALRFVVTHARIDTEVVYAALSTYLLAGIFFAQIYLAIDSAWPGSFAAPNKFSEPAAVYYSFVTLATLGYGDIVPRSDLARGVATFEVIGGQLFLAVTVARLVGLFGSSKRTS